MNSETGKYIMIIGSALLLIGCLVYFFHDNLRWIGRLPGDIRIRRENFSFYFPITTMIILSVLITVILRVARAILK